MKKLIVLTLSLLLLGVLVACSAASSATGTQAASAGTPSADGTPGPGGFQMSTLTKLLLGTFRLEGTAQAVTAQQAQALVPLWQAVNSLSRSDTAAEAEMTALEQQIQGTFTAEQLSAIEALNLSPADLQSVMADQGIAFGNAANSTPQAGGTSSGPFPGGGGFPDGGPGGDGGGFAVGGPGGGGFNPQDLSPEQQATLQAGGAGRAARGAGVPAPLVDALIKLLQARAA